jgi:hypothetical protein
MKLALYGLAAVLGATAAGCAGPYYGDNYNSRPSYSPNAAYAPQYSNETPDSRYGYYSKGDYYRNYGGTYHPGPERNCPGC